MDGRGDEAGSVSILGYAGVLVALDDLRIDDCEQIVAVFFEARHVEQCGRCERSRQCVRSWVINSERMWREALVDAGVVRVIE